MTTLLEIREKLRNFYSKGEVYLTPLFKFILATIVLLSINASIGYMDRLNNTMIVLIASLLCSFLPWNFIVVFGALFICGHCYAVTLEAGLVALALVVLMFLLYFRFSPKDALVVALMPLFFVLKIPFLIPIAVGLLCSPVSIVSVACGSIVYYTILYFKENAQAIIGLEADGSVAKFRYIIDGLLGKKEMFIVIVVFSVVVVLVYLLRIISVDYSWTIAICVGAVVNVVFLLIANLSYDTTFSAGGVIIGTIFSVLLAVVLQFFAFNVDYSRTEFVQFEDDEYYYYVKAVPKNTVKKTHVKVKKLS